MKKQWISLALVGVLTGFLAACGGEKPEAATGQTEQAVAATTAVKPEEGVVELSPEAVRNQALKVDTVSRRLVSDRKVFPASVEEAEPLASKVSAPVSARILSLDVEIGDYVKRGQVVATLTSTELGSAKADLLAAKARMLAVRSKLIVAQQRSRQEDYLAERGISSKREKQEAEAQLASAKAEYESALALIEASEARLLALGLTEPEVKQIVRGGDITPRFYVRSAVDGYVLRHMVRRGEVVQPGETVFDISGLTEVWVILKVFQSDLGRLQEGDQVRFTVRSQGNRTVTGKVVRVSDYLDPQTRAGDVRVVIPNPDRRLKPGMLLQAEVNFGSSSREVLAVPEKAVYEVKGKSVVFVRETTTRYVARPIETGNRIGEFVEITGGLKSGEPVVVEGGFVLKAELLKS